MAFSLNTLPMELKDRDYTGPIQGAVGGLAAYNQQQKQKEELNLANKKLDLLALSKFGIKKEKPESEKTPEEKEFDRIKHTISQVRPFVQMIDDINYPAFYEKITSTHPNAKEYMYAPDAFIKLTPEAKEKYKFEIGGTMDHMLSQSYDDIKYPGQRVGELEKQRYLNQNKEQKMSPILEAVGIDAGKGLNQDAKSMTDAFRGIRSAEEAEKLLEKGIIAGKFAGAITAGANIMQSWFGDVGKDIMMSFGISPEKVSNTETFVASAGDRVLAAIKPLGTGSAVSDTDRQFVQQLVAGDISLTPQAIKNLLFIYKKAILSQTVDHNNRVKEWAKTTKVDVPEYMIVNIPKKYSDLYEKEYSVSTIVGDEEEGAKKGDIVIPNMNQLKDLIKAANDGVSGASQKLSEAVNKLKAAGVDDRIIDNLAQEMGINLFTRDDSKSGGGSNNEKITPQQEKEIRKMINAATGKEKEEMIKEAMGLGLSF